MDKSILITGCSSGIGYDAAHCLRKAGWHVFASCRKIEDTRRLEQEGFHSPLIDYADTRSIESGLQSVLDQTGGRLDAVFNNGAYALPGLVEDLPRGALAEIFETNLFGYHDLTRRVIPIMRDQRAGRIVNCSSVLGLVAMPWRGAYNATKFALEGLTQTMRMELFDTGIHVSLIQPGPIGTKIRLNARPHFEKWIDWENSSQKERYRNGLVKRLNSDKHVPDRFELPPSAVSEKLLHAVTAKKPRPCYYVTAQTHGAGILRRLLPRNGLERLLSRM